MPLYDFLAESGDKFEVDESACYPSFPCCCCVHRKKNEEDYPCRVCGYNVNSESE